MYNGIFNRREFMKLNNKIIFKLNAKIIEPNFKHHFSELFTSERALNKFLKNHPNVIKKSINLFELNPI